MDRMKMVLILLMFMASCICGTHSKEGKYLYDKIRLPGNVLPSEYQVFLHPNITDGKFTVTGHVRILLDVKEETDTIILHSVGHKHFYVAVHEGQSIGKLGRIIRAHAFPQPKTEMLVVKLGEKLSTKSRYILYIVFGGKLQTGMRGFYKSSYKTLKGEKRYLATSHFEPTGARLAFPCFDEPAMKANFTIVMVREKIHTALSNMPVKRTVTRGDGLMEDHFENSVKMSTYLVAFVVSDFAHLSTESSRGIKIRVWAPPHLISQAKYAIEVTPKILDHYEKFFKVDFPLPKQDLIAIPDFAAGAMENWGLITYRLTALLYDEKESSSANKQRVAEVIAHELAHQWFGNLVTMKWWNDLWLNEGFAAFVQSIGADFVEKSWQMMDQFVNTNVHASLSADGKLNSHAISVPVKDPADIGALFDLISYNKGASIIRMMQDFIGRDRFQNGLADYLNTHKFGNAVSDDLWACLTKATGGEINVKEIMDTWTRQMGYPVVHVTRDPDNNKTALLTQERFLADVKSGKVSQTSPYNFTWEVPLTYYYQNDQYKQRKWFHIKDASVKLPWDDKAGWIKVNVDEIGFYRVNYDDANWKALTAQLNKDHTKLSGADRSNLLDDAFALAEAGMISQLTALDLTVYLKNEREYIPYSSGMSSLGSIGGLLLHRDGYKPYEKYILQQVSPLVDELGWEDKGTHLNKFLRGIVLRTAVHHNHTTAVQNALKIYKEWMSSGTEIPANLRSVVYLAGIKYGGEKEWNFMFKKYQSSIYPSEKVSLMYALADTSDPKILKNYLEMSLNEDIVKSQDTGSLIGVIAGNPIATKMARDFVKTKWGILYKRYGTGMTHLARIIKAVFGRGKTRTELKEANHFLFSGRDLGSAKLAAKQILASIRNNINWLAKNEKSVTMWLNSH